MKFIFQAKTQLGEMKEGRVEAISQDAVLGMLRDKGLVPISVEIEKEVSGIEKEIQRIWEGVNLRELSVFFRQLATLIGSKVSVVSSLRAVGEQTDNKYLASVISGMTSDIEDGLSMAEAMSKYPEVFSNLMVSMIKAGELSGNLQRSIQFLATNTEKSYELNAKVKGAMFYPLFVLGFSLIIGFVVVSFVIPKLTEVFKGMDLKLPWYTRALMDIGGFMQSYWWAVLVVILTIIAGIIYYVKTEEGKKEWDAIKMKLPIVGDLFKYVYISRFSENLAVLIEGGIPIVRSLTIVSEVVDNTVYEAVILRAADEVKSGGFMSNVFAKSNYFPAIVSQMIKIGEESGKVSEVLKNVSDFYTKETERITRNLSTMMEPIIMIMLGGMVAVLVFSVFVPIYNMTSVMGAG